LWISNTGLAGKAFSAGLRRKSEQLPFTKFSKWGYKVPPGFKQAVSVSFCPPGMVATGQGEIPECPVKPRWLSLARTLHEDLELRVNLASSQIGQTVTNTYLPYPQIKI
jgi:hypothetical protein